jgi:4-aminobutyrate aminotransferase/(S)-3-amino-2-methylpropionate transaminase
LDLAQRLADLAPVSRPAKPFFCNSGAEAVEWAVRIARIATGRPAVLAFDGGYHGRTFLCSTLTSRAKPYRQGIVPLAPEVYHVPYATCYRCPWDKSPPRCDLRCLQAVERFFLLERAPEDVAAILVEPVQGEGGVVVPPDGFLPGLREICDRHGILLVVDEVQAGLGRTGETFAVAHSGIRPDLLVLGKALGGGLPLAAVIGSSSIMDAPHGSGLGSTFGGNPVACRGALALLDALQGESLSERAREIWHRFDTRAILWKDRFRSIGDVRGRGAMLGIELVKNPQTNAPAPALARRVVRSCFQNGVILMSGGVHRNVLRLLPPLNIPWAELDRGFEVLEAALGENPEAS